jgi:hypothetical protein
MDDFDFDVDSLTEEQTEQIQEVASELGVDLPDDFDEDDLKEAASELMESGGFGGGQPGEQSEPPEMPDNQNGQGGEMPDNQNGQGGEMPQGQPDDSSDDGDSKGGMGGDKGGMGGDRGGMDGDKGGGMGDAGGGMSMGSADVKLQYIDDDPDSYSNIFDNAKTKVSDADKTRLIESLKSLSSYEDIEDVVNVDEVLRYFVVHNFMCNGDSYTGNMVHNYYLYEDDGQLSMIPWDYNLSFGAFQSSSATDTVNSAIDSPVSGGSVDDRPMIGWIFSDESYTQMYHEYFSEFLDSVDIVELITQTQELIAPYVEKDPTSFYSYEEFETGVETLKEFCTLRIESIRGQLDGTIGSTSEAQTADPDSLIDASDLNISDMGSMNQGGQGGPDSSGGDPGSQGGFGGAPGNQGDADGQGGFGEQPKS